MLHINYISIQLGKKRFLDPDIGYSVGSLSWVPQLRKPNDFLNLWSLNPIYAMTLPPDTAWVNTQPIPLSHLFSVIS